MKRVATTVTHENVFKVVKSKDRIFRFPESVQMVNREAFEIDWLAAATT